MMFLASVKKVISIVLVFSLVLSACGGNTVRRDDNLATAAMSSTGNNDVENNGYSSNVGNSQTIETNGDVCKDVSLSDLVLSDGIAKRESLLEVNKRLETVKAAEKECIAGSQAESVEDQCRQYKIALFTARLDQANAISELKSLPPSKDETDTMKAFETARKGLVICLDVNDHLYEECIEETENLSKFGQKHEEAIKAEISALKAKKNNVWGR